MDGLPSSGIGLASRGCLPYKRAPTTSSESLRHIPVRIDYGLMTSCTPNLFLHLCAATPSPSTTAPRLPFSDASLRPMQMARCMYVVLRPTAATSRLSPSLEGILLPCSSAPVRPLSFSLSERVLERWVSSCSYGARRRPFGGGIDWFELIVLSG